MLIGTKSYSILLFHGGSIKKANSMRCRFTLMLNRGSLIGSMLWLAICYVVKGGTRHPWDRREMIESIGCSLTMWIWLTDAKDFVLAMPTIVFCLKGPKTSLHRGKGIGWMHIDA